MEYYLTLKKNKLWIPARAWMNLKGIILNEKNQSRVYKSHDFIYIAFLLLHRVKGEDEAGREVSNMKYPCGVGKFLHVDCIKVNILVLILYYNFQDITRKENWLKSIIS